MRPRIFARTLLRLPEGPAFAPARQRAAGAARLMMPISSQASHRADQVVSRMSDKHLACVIYEFGEERRLRRIVRAIVRARSDYSYRSSRRCIGRAPVNETLSRYSFRNHGILNPLTVPMPPPRCWLYFSPFALSTATSVSRLSLEVVTKDSTLMSDTTLITERTNH